MNRKALEVMERHDYPLEAKSVFVETDRRICACGKWKAEMQRLTELFMRYPAFPIGHFLNRLGRLAEEMELSAYTVHFVFYQNCMEALWEHYQRAGIPEEIFFDSMGDFRSKLSECMEIFGVPGTSVAWWQYDFFHLDRFALGRLQFELRPFEAERYEKDGHEVREGDPVINMHIPSGAPLTEEACLDSFHRAYGMYREHFHDGTAVFVCNSWLLDPQVEEVLPSCNIRKFRRFFEIIQSTAGTEFADGWRVFGKEWKNRPEELPRNTKLQRAYADHLQGGGLVGSGYGVFFYDGERVL